MTKTPPTGLKLIVLLMGACALAGPLVWQPNAHTVVQALDWATPLVCLPVLWALWLGKSWARWLVLATAIVVVIPYALFMQIDIMPPHRSGWVDARAFALVEGVLGVVVFVYLCRSRVRAYFKLQVQACAS